MTEANTQLGHVKLIPQPAPRYCKRGSNPGCFAISGWSQLARAQRSWPENRRCEISMTIYSSDCIAMFENASIPHDGRPATWKLQAQAESAMTEASGGFRPTCARARQPAPCALKTSYCRRAAFRFAGRCGGEPCRMVSATSPVPPSRPAMGITSAGSTTRGYPDFGSARSSPGAQWRRVTRPHGCRRRAEEPFAL